MNYYLHDTNAFNYAKITLLVTIIGISGGWGIYFKHGYDNVNKQLNSILLVIERLDNHIKQDDREHETQANTDKRQDEEIAEIRNSK